MDIKTTVEQYWPFRTNTNTIHPAKTAIPRQYSLLWNILSIVRTVSEWLWWVTMVSDQSLEMQRAQLALGRANLICGGKLYQCMLHVCLCQFLAVTEHYVQLLMQYPLYKSKKQRMDDLPCIIFFAKLVYHNKCIFEQNCYQKTDLCKKNENETPWLS